MTAVNLHEIIKVDDQLSIQALVYLFFLENRGINKIINRFYAGHVLGAAMFLVKVGDESVLLWDQIFKNYLKL